MTCLISDYIFLKINHKKYLTYLLNYKFVFGNRSLNELVCYYVLFNKLQMNLFRQDHSMVFLFLV